MVAAYRRMQNTSWQQIPHMPVSSKDHRLVCSSKVKISEGDRWEQLMQATISRVWIGTEVECGLPQTGRGEIALA